jgi:hypothetical protein
MVELCRILRATVGDARSSGESVGALASGWGWVTGPDFGAVLGMASLAVTAIGVWAGVAALCSALRGLHVRTRVVRERDQSVVRAARQKWPGAHPHKMVLKLTLRGRSAIEEKDFSQNADLIFDVGAPIFDKGELHIKPKNASRPDTRVCGSELHVPPTLINPGTRMSFDLITAYRPEPVQCPAAMLANVRIHGLHGDERSWRAYQMPLVGAAAILIELCLPYIVPRLSAMRAYKVTSILLCVIVWAIIAASTIRLARRPHGHGM